MRKTKTKLHAEENQNHIQKKQNKNFFTRKNKTKQNKTKQDKTPCETFKTTCKKQKQNPFAKKTLQMTKKTLCKKKQNKTEQNKTITTPLLRKNKKLTLER